MRKSDDPELIRVAEAISDGLPVDWEEEVCRRSDLSMPLVRLRQLETLAKAHEEAALAETGPAAPPGQDEQEPALPARWGTLQILGKLGQGRFGEVYRALDPALQREVALKLRRPLPEGSASEVAQILEEARRMARIRHSNVLTIHGADLRDGQLGFWTDLLDGRTLEQVLAEGGVMGAREAALIGIDLCRALAAVHQAGQVHGDVKTTNVMRESGGRIVLMDFGSVTDFPMPLTSPKEVAARPRSCSGTPLAMAPEMLLRGAGKSPVTDLYALGVLLYRLVTSRYPVEGETLDDLIRRHAASGSIPLRDRRPDLPAEFVQVIEKALAADPGDRFPSAGAMERGLADSLEGAAMGWSDPSRLPGESRPRGRRLILGVAGLAALALIVAGAVSILSGPPSVLSVEASMYREADGAQQRLVTGNRVQPEDRLFLELRSSAPAHVYVLNEDATGKPYVLFPAGLDLENPLAGGTMHRLPGSLAGVPQSWVVTSPGLRETFLILASRAPLRDLEQEIQGLPRAVPGRPVEYHFIDPTTLDGLLRSVSGMAPSSAPQRGGALRRISSLAGLPPGGQSSGDVWMRVIELENPPR